MTSNITIEKNPHRRLWRYRVRWVDRFGCTWTLDKMTLRAARRWKRKREDDLDWRPVT